jgi:hypothetical protein
VCYSGEMETDILCGVLKFSSRLDPRLVADKIATSDAEFVAAYKGGHGETIVLFSLGARSGRDMVARFVKRQRLAFGADLIEASAGLSLSRTIRLPK